MTDLNELMKQAQRMQEQFQKAQQEMANKVVQGESGAGMVKIEMNGRHDVSKVSLDPSLLNEEAGIVEDLIAAAINDAVRKIDEQNKESLGAMAGGLQMPEGFKFPF